LGGKEKQTLKEGDLEGWGAEKNNVAAEPAGIEVGVPAVQLSA